MVGHKLIILLLFNNLAVLKSICGGSSKIWAGLYNGTVAQIYPAESTGITTTDLGTKSTSIAYTSSGYNKYMTLTFDVPITDGLYNINCIVTSSGSLNIKTYDNGEYIYFNIVLGGKYNEGTDIMKYYVKLMTAQYAFANQNYNTGYTINLNRTYTTNILTYVYTRAYYSRAVKFDNTITENGYGTYMHITPALESYANNNFLISDNTIPIGLYMERDKNTTWSSGTATFNVSMNLKKINI